ncbi:hypothetical protein LguiB_013510 [Lonicera macranthoides]
MDGLKSPCLLKERYISRPDGLSTLADHLLMLRILPDHLWWVIGLPLVDAKKIARPFVVGKMKAWDHKLSRFSLFCCRLFVSAVSFATSSLPLSITDLKTSAQEQLEYMLTEDDDAPLLTADDEIKLEVRESVKRLLARFNSLIETLLCGPEELDFEGGAI